MAQWNLKVQDDIYPMGGNAAKNFIFCFRRKKRRNATFRENRIIGLLIKNTFYIAAGKNGLKIPHYFTDV